MNLTERYRKLKIRIPGNREKRGYEETFGLPREEAEHITPIARYSERILSEIEFSIRLSDSQKNRFDTAISKALDILEKALNDHAALLPSDADEAEKALMPLAEEAKKYKLICASHAHIDMNWLWGFRETVAITLATFRTVLNIMAEYPDFCFTQSQASVYQIVEEYAPEMMKEIKKRIKEGRWDVAATSWVEPDKNMPTGESLLRHIRYTKKYLRDVWGVEEEKLEVDFVPDTFGHSACIPEIDLFSDVKYAYQCRGRKGNEVLFRWRAPSGSELLVYREPYWYNSSVTPKAGIGIIDISRRCAGLKTGMIVYGVGDHGGGPTRRDVEAVIELNSWPVFPTFVFGTTAEFFHEAESVREQLPLLDKELNFLFGGCYTTQSRIKMGNRMAEKALLNAEAMSSLASFELGVPYDDKAFELAWRNVLFTHFHDLIPGSCVVDSREHAMGLLSAAMATADSRCTAALQSIAAAIDTSSLGDGKACPLSRSEGGGVGYGLNLYNGVPNPERGTGLKRIFTVFNSSAFDREENVEITVWDWMGDHRWIKVTDSEGNPLEFQLLNGDNIDFWAHMHFGILVRVKVPAFSYKTVILEPAEASVYPVYYQTDNRIEEGFSDVVLENENVRCVISAFTGRVLSLIDKKTGKDSIQEPSGFDIVETEHDSNDGWHIGRYIERKTLDKPLSFRYLGTGNLRSACNAVYTYGSSRIEYTASLEKGSKAVRFDFKADWRQFDGATTPIAVFSLKTGNKQSYLYDIPEGAVRRTALPIDVPGLTFGAAEEDGRILFLSTDTKYGYRAYDGYLTATLINTSRHPDPWSEIGEHHVTLWAGFEEDNDCAAITESTKLNNPLIFISNGCHKGTLPLDFTFMKVKTGSCILSSVGTRNGGTELFFYETAGKNTTVTVSTGLQITEAEEIGTMGEAKRHLNIKDGSVSMRIPPYSIRALRIRH